MTFIEKDLLIQPITTNTLQVIMVENLNVSIVFVSKINFAYYFTHITQVRIDFGVVNASKV